MDPAQIQTTEWERFNGQTHGKIIMEKFSDLYLVLPLVRGGGGSKY